MRRPAILATLALMTVPATAWGMPLTPALPERGLILAQTDPCQPGAPPVRVYRQDQWGRTVETIVPAYRYCRERDYYHNPGTGPMRAPPPVYYDAPPPRRYYDGDDGYAPPPRRPPPPGWERDPYTGRDMRILR